MSKRKHAPHPTPRGNRGTFGPSVNPPVDEADAADTERHNDAAFNEQDPKRRLGGFETAGEHSIVQPGGKNDAQRGAGRT
jgi:hypothetical protein